MAREMHVGLFKMSRERVSEIGNTGIEIGTGTAEGMTSTRLVRCDKDDLGNLWPSLQQQRREESTFVGEDICVRVAVIHQS